MTMLPAAAGKREVKRKKSQKSWRTWQRGTPWPPAVAEGGEGGRRGGRCCGWGGGQDGDGDEAAVTTGWAGGGRHTWQYLKTRFLFKSPI